MTPFPCVARILPQRLVLPDLQNLHSLHSGVLLTLAINGVLGGLDVLEGNDMVAGLYIGDALTDGLDVSGTFVTEDDWEGTLGVLAGECVGICVADTGVVDLNADFVCPGRKNLNLLDGEVFAGFPSNCSLWRCQTSIRRLLFPRSRSPVTSASSRIANRESSADPHAKPDDGI